jgi:3-dehydroquinate synthase
MSGRRINVGLGERSYDIVVEPGGLARAGAWAAELGDVTRCFVVTNPTVEKLWGEAAERALEAGLPGVERVWVRIEDGEQYKTVATLERIWDALLDGRADRHALVVALGGGVVGDVAGFAAATTLRGLRVVMLPTTLLAQVDSSVGGKTAVNRPQGKNLVGAFHQPALVVADPDTLTTLPEREYRAGLAEVVKYGVILDAELFALLEREAASVVARDRELMTDIVARCVELKAQVVEADEREGGLRRILNFGHTVGHAIEQVTGYSRYLHGETVAMGMGEAARISRELDLCGDQEVGRVETLLARLGLEHRVPADLSIQALMQAVASDKKVLREHVAFIVCHSIGAVDVRKLPPAAVAASLERSRAEGSR